MGEVLSAPCYMLFFEIKSHRNLGAFQLNPEKHVLEQGVSKGIYIIWMPDAHVLYE